MSRGLTSTEINITKVIGQGADLPAFFGVVHRHFQKSVPFTASSQEATLVVPLDLLAMLVPEQLINSIESITVTYRKGSK